MELDVIARRLAVQRAAAQDRVTDLTAELERHVAASVGSNADDEHDPEGATLAWERQQLVAARSAAQQQLADLDAAALRLAQGRYGQCAQCGDAIGAQRLEALPAATRCIVCAR